MITHRRFYDRIAKAVVKREGSRASDNMRFAIDGSSNIQEGDEVYFIQDVIDTQNLTSLHNFYGNFRDESGYEHDDYYTGNYSMPAAVDGTTHTEMDNQTGKWKGLYKMKLAASNSTDGLKMHRRFVKQDDSNPPIIDLSGDFDIYIALKFQSFSSYGANPTLIDLYDSTSSKGLRIEYDHSNTDLKITSNSGSGSDNVSVVDYTFSTNANYLIRVGRIGGVIKCYINKVAQTVSNSSYSGDLNNTNAFWYLGRKFTTSWVNDTGFKGWFQQIRTYNKFLTDNEHFKIWASKPAALTMKFGGRIWKAKSDKTKWYEARSHSAELLGTNLSAFNLTGTPSNSNIERKGTVYSGGTAEEIITDILENIGSDEFVHFTQEPDNEPFSSANNYAQAHIVATGSFLQLLETLIMLQSDETFEDNGESADQFYWSILPRKVLIIEKFLRSNYVVDESHFRVIESYKDDTKTTNKLLAVGDLSPKKGYDTKTYAGLSGAGSYTAEAPISDDIGGSDVLVDYVIKATAAGTEINEWISDSNPTGGDASNHWYKFNNDKSKVKFWNPTSGSTVYAMDFIYKSTVSGLAGATIIERSDATSIAENGLYHRRVNIPNIRVVGNNTSLNLQLYATNFVKQHKNIPLRVKMDTSSIINALNIGQVVQVSYITKNLYTSYNSSTKAVVPLQLKVRSIEWRYPESRTIVELGDHEWNSFDVEKETISSIKDLDTSTRAVIGV